MFCPQCGSQLNEGARFCPKCGAQMHASSDAAHAPDAVSEVHPASMADPGDTAPSAPRPRRRLNPIAIAAAAIAVLAASGAAIWFLFFAPFTIDEKTFPDTALRIVVSRDCDLDKNGELSREEGRAVTDIVLEDPRELDGLGKFFPNLESLTVSGGKLTRLDVADLGSLAHVTIPDEPIKSLDVSKNKNLLSMSVGNDVDVTGVESSGLKEVWAVSQIEQTSGESRRFTVERNGVGRILELSYEDVDIQTGERDIFGIWKNRIYQLDDEGNPVSSKSERFGASGDIEDFAYTYDDAGNVTRMESITNGTVSTYTFDDEGRLTESAVTSFAPDQTRYTEYSYDGERLVSSYTWFEGEEVQRASRFGDPANPFTTTYAYDNEGRCVKIDEQAEDVGGWPPYHNVTTYELDDDGNVVHIGYESSHFKGRVPVDFDYDEEGRMISATCSDPSAFTFDVSFEYDERGNLVLAEQRSSHAVAASSTDSYSVSYCRYFLPEDSKQLDDGFGLTIRMDAFGNGTLADLLNVYLVDGIEPQADPYRSGWDAYFQL